jgi:hypothetical protein
MRIARVHSTTRSKGCGGKKISIGDADFLEARTDWHDKFLQFAADLYIEQIKWSLISPKKHQFLYTQATENLDKWWRVEIAKRLRARR